MSWLLGGVALALTLFSALLSAAETATLALADSQLRTLNDEGFKGASALGAVRADPGSLYTALILLSTSADTMAVGSLLWWAVLADVPGFPALPLAVSMAGVILMAEVAPRMIAARRPVRIALGLAPLLVVVEGIVSRILHPIGRLEDLLEQRNSEDGSSHDERVVREISEIGREEGVVGEEEHLLVERAFKLDELTAWDAMIPRVDIFAWQDSQTLDAIVRSLDSVPFSRVPVYGDSIDDITGILYVREVYEAVVAGRTDVTLKQLAREPLFIPGSLSLTRLLSQFQARRIHMGIVADEFGGTDGLVTLEDILEELVGEIVDETDVDEELILRVSRSEIIVNASIDVREINYAFNVALPHIEHRSLNGFILEELGQVPEAGEVLWAPGVKVEILDASETQVLRARLTREAPTLDDPST